MLICKSTSAVTNSEFDTRPQKCDAQSGSDVHAHRRSAGLILNQYGQPRDYYRPITSAKASPGAEFYTGAGNGAWLTEDRLFNQRRTSPGVELPHLP